MQKRARWLVAILALCIASTALAVKQGESLYVKARNTRLMASTSPTANVVTVLQPGQQVKWLGADSKNKQWHRVEAGGKKGLVFQSNLSTQPPNMELIAKDGARQVDPVAFASSAAAVKGLSQGAIDYGHGKKTPDLSEAVKQVQEIELIAEQITPQELAEHATRNHLFPVVGPRTAASRGAR